MPAVVSAVAKSILMVLQYLLLARVVISWLPVNGSNSFVRVLYMVTEPILAPVRKFLMRFGALRRLPVDFSVLIVFMLIALLYPLL